MNELNLPAVPTRDDSQVTPVGFGSVDNNPFHEQNGNTIHFVPKPVAVVTASVLVANPAQALARPMARDKRGFFSRLSDRLFPDQLSVDAKFKANEEAAKAKQLDDAAKKLAKHKASFAVVMGDVAALDMEQKLEKARTDASQAREKAQKHMDKNGERLVAVAEAAKAARDANAESVGSQP
jgi:hypothetical protein